MGKKLFILLIISSLLFSGCDWIEDGKTAFSSSQLPRMAELNGTTVWLSEICHELYSKKDTKIVHMEGIWDQYNVCQVLAGKNYFYFLAYGNEKKTIDTNYLIRCNLKMDKAQVATVPYSRISVQDDKLWGYYDSEENLMDGVPIGQVVEATNYVEEKDWDKTWKDLPLNQRNDITLSGTKLFYHSKDDLHNAAYFSTEKRIEDFSGYESIIYKDNELFSGEMSSFVQKNISKIRSDLIGENEKNFSLTLFQKDNKIIGFCNVYSKGRLDPLATLASEDIKYSFSFQYDELKQKFSKAKIFNNGKELGYADGNHFVYRQKNAVYSFDAADNNSKKICEYDTLRDIEINIWAGLCVISDEKISAPVKL